MSSLLDLFTVCSTHSKVCTTRLWVYTIYSLLVWLGEKLKFLVVDETQFSGIWRNPNSWCLKRPNVLMYWVCLIPVVTYSISTSLIGSRHSYSVCITMKHIISYFYALCVPKVTHYNNLTYSVRVCVLCCGCDVLIVVLDLTKLTAIYLELLFLKTADRNTVLLYKFNIYLWLY